MVCDKEKEVCNKEKKTKGNSRYNPHNRHQDPQRALIRQSLPAHRPPDRHDTHRLQMPHDGTRHGTRSIDDEEL